MPSLLINRFRMALILSALITVTACTNRKGDESIASDLIRHTNPVNVEKGYPFSEAVETDGWVFLSGALGIAPGGKGLVKGGIEAETRQTMDNIQASLRNLELGMDRIVKCTVMIDDMADWPAFNAVYVTYFDDTYPARSVFGADGLALGANVEVECIARR